MAQGEGGGRPTKYETKYNRQAYRLALLGATDVEMADFFEVTEQTINNWKTDYPKFFESIKKGKADADAQVAQSLYKRANGYSHKGVKIFHNGPDKPPTVVPYVEHYPPDTTAAIFWLKNRQPEKWRDRQELTGKDGAPLIAGFNYIVPTEAPDYETKDRNPDTEAEPKTT